MISDESQIIFKVHRNGVQRRAVIIQMLGYLKIRKNKFNELNTIYTDKDGGLWECTDVMSSHIS